MTEPIPEHIFDPLCLTIGHLILGWSFVDGAVTACVISIYRDYEGNRYENEIPRMWRRRAKFLRKRFNNEPKLAQFKHEAILLLDQASRLAEVRDFLAHGALREYDENRDHLLRFSKIDTADDRQSHVENDLLITAKELALRAVECRVLAAKFGQLALNLITVATNE